LASPLIEAEVLNDMAHLTLDLASFFGPPDWPFELLLFWVTMAVMGADCPIIPCYRKSWCFRFFMLGLAWMALSEITMPVILSVMASNIALRDGKAFSPSSDLRV
jgi:hypothetical protein